MFCPKATEANRRELKSGLDNVKSENIANFTGAFVTAFEILHKVLIFPFKPHYFGLNIVEFAGSFIWKTKTSNSLR